MNVMIRWIVLLAVATAGGAAAADPTVTLSSFPSATLATASSGTATLLMPSADPTSTVLAYCVIPGALAEELRIGGAQIQVRRLSYSAGEQQLSLVVPDGDASMVVEQRVQASSVRMGMHYNFFLGTVQAWVTYVLPLVGERLKLQVSASDVIGLGTVYLGRSYLERAQSVPVGLAWEIGRAHV